MAAIEKLAASLVQQGGIAAAGYRKGKGKGAPEQWVAVIRPGRILFEMEGVSASDAKRAMELAVAKLPIQTQFATRFGETGV